MGDGGRLAIGIDGYNLALPQGTGVATYARNVARTVAMQGHKVDLVYSIYMPRKIDPKLREAVFLGHLLNPPTRKMKRRYYNTLPFVSYDMMEIPASGHVIAQGVENRVPAHDRLFNLKEMFAYSIKFFRRYGRFLTLRIPSPPDVMHWTYPLPVRIADTRNIYTIHDLVPLRLPTASTEDKILYDRLVRHCVTQGDHVVTVSENSRNDILTLLDADPAKVTNAYQVSDMPALRDPATLDTRLRQLFDLERGGYFLFVGAIEPKKNLGRLIEAYLEADIATPFVIVGKEGWYADNELRLLRGGHGTELRGAARIRRIDYLPQPLLSDLIAGARAALFPSLYEGFGLPALEAMALGTPVLASTTGSLPEIVGDAAVQVDPYDVGALAAALRRLDRDAALRARLAAAGPVRAARFDRARFGQALDTVYRHVLAQ